MKTLLEKMKKENLEKLESYKDKFPTSVKSCLKSLTTKNYWIDNEYQKLSEIEEFGFAKTLISKQQETLF